MAGEGNAPVTEETEVLSALMDTLLPGGDGFPAASETGMTQVFVTRLRAADGALPARLVEAIKAQGPLPAGAQSWHDAAMRLEAVEPKLFEELLKYAYLTYYEQPETVATIRALGIRYNAAPLPEGYPGEPFAAERDAPRHDRGRWIATADVRRVDLGQLDLEGVE